MMRIKLSHEDVLGLELDEILSDVADVDEDFAAGCGVDVSIAVWRDVVGDRWRSHAEVAANASALAAAEKTVVASCDLLETSRARKYTDPQVRRLSEERRQKRMAQQARWDEIRAARDRWVATRNHLWDIALRVGVTLTPTQVERLHEIVDAKAPANRLAFVRDWLRDMGLLISPVDAAWRCALGELEEAGFKIARQLR
jgi:hypothetical protein